MGLFKPAWKDNNEKKALKAIHKLKDQKKIAMAAKEAGGWRVRQAAVDKLNAQNELENIAFNEKDQNVRKAAIGKITNQKALAALVKNDPEYDICITAVNRLTDQELLLDIAKNGKETRIRVIAAGKLTDKTALLNIVRKEKDPYVHETALEKITDSSVLVEILLNAADNMHIDHIFRRLAELNTLNADSLSHILKNAKDNYAQTLALQHMGGYYCSACKFQNLPLNEQPAPCKCKQCGTDNHVFEDRSWTEEIAHTTVRVTTWKECKRCRLERDSSSEIRFTDW